MKRLLIAVGILLLASIAFAQLGEKVTRVPTTVGGIVLQCTDPDGVTGNIDCLYDITILDQDVVGMLRWQGSLDDNGTPGVINAMRGLMNALRAQAVAQLAQP